MRTKIAAVFVIFAVGAAVFHVAKRDSFAQTGEGATSEQSVIDHGKYLVHHVAMCVQCHSARGENGALDAEQLLQGAAVPIESPFQGQRWAFQAPKLAGLPGGWSEQDLTRFLQTGTTTTGHTPMPPMPPFRMNEHDATAVAVYLKSLR